MPDADLRRAGPEIMLEFGIAAADIEDAVARLLRAPVLNRCRGGSLRNIAARIIWHDTADGALADEGLALCQIGGTPAKPSRWRLERLYPASALDWPPAIIAPVLAEGDGPDRLGRSWPAPLAPAAAFQGRLRTLPLTLRGGPARLFILAGTLRGIARDQPTCRIILAGQSDDVTALAQLLAETFRLRPPPASLAAEALALARGRMPAPRQTGAPKLPTGLTAGEALAGIAAHLADVMLHWSALVPVAASPEPVHQMRVAVRRLRSALGVFRRATVDEAGASPWLDSLADALRTLAGRLGVARDWDVFVTETGAEILAAFPHDRRIAQLLAASGRRHVAAYADLATYFASQDWTRMAMTLALLPTARPWAVAAVDGGGLLASPARHYAAGALDRRLKHLLKPGSDLSGLSPSQLHDIRKQAKRLRYATEFFAPLFGEKAVRKYLPRLQRLQEVLGAVNDTDVAAGLMAQLAGGAVRAFAAGVVQGFGVARAARASARVQRSWSRFTQAEPFWD